MEKLIQIEERIIECVRNRLPDNLQWIVNAELDASDREHPVCIGVFKVDNQAFSRIPKNYLGCPQALVCVNQIGYVAWAEFLKQKLIDSDMSYEEFLNLPDDAVYMIETERLKFRGKIDTRKEICGKIKLEWYRERENQTYAVGSFKLEERSCIGTAKFTIRRGKVNQGNL